MRVALLGSQGFVGGAVAADLRERDVTVVQVRAPRLELVAPPRDCDARRMQERRWLASEAGRRAVAELAGQLDGVVCVINAAGLAQPDSRWESEVLFGANALLPAVVAAASASAGCRAVHVSSAAVQSGLPGLDEGAATAPTSAYSWSKADGEVLFEEAVAHGAVYRATSVQGRQRQVTRALLRLVDLPALPLAHPARPIPLSLISTTASAISHLALSAEASGRYLHPWEGVDTDNLVRALGGSARRVPVPARAGSGALRVLRRLSSDGQRPRLASLANRASLLLEGVTVEATRLAETGWYPPADTRGYAALRIR